MPPRRPNADRRGARGKDRNGAGKAAPARPKPPRNKPPRNKPPRNKLPRPRRERPAEHHLSAEAPRDRGPAPAKAADTRGDDAAASAVQTLAVTAEEAGLRFDRWFRRRFPEVPHGHLRKLLRSGQIRVEGARVDAARRLEAGEAVRVPPLKARATAPVARPSPRPPSDEESAALMARVLHRGPDIIAIDKPAGLAVQGGTGTTRHLDALLDALRFEASERPRLVHRLDKDTSGVLLLARNARAAAQLTAAFRDGRVDKVYWAIVMGVPHPLEGTVDAPLAKRPGAGGEKMEIDAEGDRAVTHYRVLDRAGKVAAWVELEPETGRTHQLRVHCAHLGTPILGDGKYGGAPAVEAAGGRTLLLHARALRLHRSVLGGLEVVCPPPVHFRDALAHFGFSAPAEPSRARENRRRAD